MFQVSTFNEREVKGSISIQARRFIVYDTRKIGNVFGRWLGIGQLKGYHD